MFVAFCHLLLILPWAAAQAGLYLAINPLAYMEDGEVVKRRLEVNWYGQQPFPDDEIILYQGIDHVEIKIFPHNYTDGFFIYEDVTPYPTMDEMGYNRTCVFGHRVEWLTSSVLGSTVLAEACLESQPTWMEEHREELGDLSIGDLMLAGAHDAGAYRDYQGVGDDNWATQAVFAQEEDLLHQLLWGVRFLDIRAGFYPTTDERFWMVHGVIKTHPMMEGINHVKQFLRNTKEILVWEINSFEQHWTDAAHAEYRDLLINEFGPWLVTPSMNQLAWDTPLAEIWLRDDLERDQGRIIITYNNGYTDPEYFFPEVSEHWGNVDEPEDLRIYLEAQVAAAVDNPAYQPWKPNCQMTPNQEDIIGGRWSGLRAMADAVNRNVTAWWRDDWPDLPSTFPISDFVKSTNMVQESIERNLRLAAKRKI